MPAVRRYLYTMGPKSTVIHLAESHIEGPTFCGRHTAPGWLYWVRAKSSPKNTRICTQCYPR